MKRNKPNSILHSFPIQLLFTHIRRNIALLAIWGILVAAMSGKLGKVYGIHYLFLHPEYLGQVNFWSFFILGITFGQLTMAFHITSYILDGHRYTFLGGLKRPFAHFALNNSLVPFTVLVLYLVLLIRFQSSDELASARLIASEIGGFLTGVVTLLIISFLYFRWTNQDIFKQMAGDVDKRLRKSGLSRERMMKRLKETKQQQRRFVVHNYFSLDFRFERTDRGYNRFDREQILKVFDQNHINSVIIGLLLIILLIVMGASIDHPILQIPAGASSILLFTIAVILLGAISFWFRGWGFSFVVGLLILVNMGVKKGLVTGVHQARGLDYEAGLAPYRLDSLRSLNDQDAYDQDIHSVLHSLENWKARQIEDKPKLIMICVSGGGQRSALWTMNAMRYADSVLDGQLMRRTVLISGASGGMIGAAYYRELYLRSLSNDQISPNDERHLVSISKDNLNPVIFSLLVNDAFVSFRKEEYKGRLYKKDRGFAFEQNLNQNMENVLDKSISDYRIPEQDGLIPTMLLAPTIANDGRKLYITSRPFSFMNIDEDRDIPNVRAVDFLRLFKDQDSEKLSFLSALRMSASFPYITPTISLPSKPRMEIMDAGIADNFGVSDALRFAYVFKKWILDNTSGIVMITIRDTEPNERIHSRPIPSLVDRLTYPIASVYNNLSSIQDRKNDAHMEQAKDWLDGNLVTIPLIYGTGWDMSEQERASLSWHLTKKEKRSILLSIRSDQNKKALNELRALVHSE